MNPVALITGASRGIGRGIALEMARLGYDLVINFAGRQEAARETAEACCKTAQEAGHTIQAETCQADVGLDVDRRRLMDFTRNRFKRLDALVNNAGITSIGRRDLLEAREEDFDRLLSVNLKGPFFLSQLAANWMIESAPAHPGDSPPPMIVTISSISAYAVSTDRADYCIAKAGLGMMTQLFAIRLAEHGIGVYEIRPGIIASDMTAPVKEKYDQLLAEGLAPMRRWGTPQDVGRAVAGLALQFLPYSTGEVINVDGGFHIRRL
jgi:NAD(P)-dependent dehydrogenase (short-subunit alcohol dehydrogenase family)